MNGFIQKCSQLFQENQWTPSVDFQTELENYDNASYNIAVVGRYQTGKTTFINQVFLRENFLATGCGICKTALPAVLTYGQDKTVVAVSRDEEGHSLSIPADASDLAKISSSENGEERLNLAKKYEEIKISWPCETLKKYTVYDTPGLDDPVEELLDYTTYKIVPRMDLVLLIVEPKQLTDVELSFLRHKLFKSGIKRLMVLISYNPDNPLSEKTRDSIIAAIKNQLANIGREYIPVHMLTYDCSVTGNVLNSVPCIADCIIRFLHENAAGGREDRLVYQCLYELQRMRNELAAKVALAGKNEEELSGIEKEIDGISEKLDRRFKSVQAAFNSKYSAFESDFEIEVNRKLQSIQNDILVSLDSYDSFSSFRNALPVITKRAKDDVETAIVDLDQYAQEKIHAVLSELEIQFDNLGGALNCPRDLNITLDTGWAGKLNPKLVVVAEFVLFGKYFGLLGAGIRLVSAFIPGLKNILPNNFLKKRAIASVKTTLEENMRELAIMLNNGIHDACGQYEQAIAAKFVDLHKLTCEPYYKTLKERRNSRLSETEIAALNDCIRRADDLMRNKN